MQVGERHFLIGQNATDCRQRRDHPWRWGHVRGGGMRLGVEPPLEVASLLSMGLAVVWGVGALDAVALRVEALSGDPS